MTSDDAVQQFFVDPSVLLSDAGLTWLEEDAQARSGVVVSENFVASIERQARRLSSVFLPHNQVELIWENRARLLGVLEGVQRFDFNSVYLEGPAKDVLGNLLSITDLESAALADEWAYLQSRSWGIGNFRPVLVAFARAGAVVVEYGRRARDEAIQVAVREESIPAKLTPPFLARVGAKWLLLGGATAGGAALGGIVGSAVLGPVGVAVGAGTAYFAGQAGTVLLRAFDA